MYRTPLPHQDPIAHCVQVSAVHLLRDETKRELSNWRRFQPYKKKAEDTQSLRFNWYVPAQEPQIPMLGVAVESKRAALRSLVVQRL